MARMMGSFETESIAAPQLPDSVELEMPQTYRARLIRQRAYELAERREFLGRNQLEEWLQAEREVDALLSSQPPGSNGLDPRPSL
ncbi:Protein of unknown function [Variovorax sp. OK605]|uniref:DUF2934 domain-containing protein n=1 Tax=Variovorax sp. OK605 TaxID=1855317 RepID=UPI0008EDEAB2|nr:DUF2934 domain-containing protein [Variovorax sp. OK605]SFQ59361.1 Protein of unknown function [Variovorax sp. OK605]